MKQLLFVVIALAASAALADIESFCGFKFGDTIGERPKTHQGTGKLSTSRVMEKPFRSFSKNAFLSATPKTRQICAVKLSCNLTKDSAEGEQQETAAVLKKKYGVEPVITTPTRVSCIYTYDVGNCIITLKRIASVLTLSAENKALEALREKECKEVVADNLKKDGDGADVL